MGTHQPDVLRSVPFPVGLNALGLLSNEWSPHTWPPYYGSPRTIFLDGVRGFWGDYWHRSMRAFSIAPGYAIADSLGLRGRSLIRYAIITTVAFGLSGFIHTGLVPPEPLHATISVNIIRMHVAAFFWLQPLAILAETVTVRLLQQVVPTTYWQSGVGLRLRMLANTVFVMIWFACCLPYLGEAGRQLGYWRLWPMPVSLWKGVRGEDWLCWRFVTP